MPVCCADGATTDTEQVVNVTPRIKVSQVSLSSSDQDDACQVAEPLDNRFAVSVNAFVETDQLKASPPPVDSVSPAPRDPPEESDQAADGVAQADSGGPATEVPPADGSAPADGDPPASTDARGPEVARESEPAPPAQPSVNVAPPAQALETVRTPGCVGQFIDTPQPQGLAKGVFLYYCGWFSTAMVAALAVRDQEWRLFIVNVCALFLPGIVHSVNMFFVLSIVKKDMDKNEKRKEALLTVLNLNKIMEVRRFYAGTPPIWSLLFKSRLVHLTSNTLPAMTINILTLVSGSLEPGFTRDFLFFNTIFGLVLASLSAKLVHTCNGPPGNMQKYRFWDVETSPKFHVCFMLVIDFCQIYHRLVGLALVAVFAGVWHEVLLIVSMSTVTAAFAKVGLQVVPAYAGVENLMSAITGFENVIYDYPWLEPVPVYSFYIEVSYLFRLLQVIIGSVIISAHWEKRLDFDQRMFYVFFGSCASCTALYLLVYPFYVFYLMKDGVEASYIKRDEFISTMLKKKFDRDSSQRLEKQQSKMSLGM